MIEELHTISSNLSVLTSARCKDFTYYLLYPIAPQAPAELSPGLSRALWISVGESTPLFEPSSAS